MSDYQLLTAKHDGRLLFEQASLVAFILKAARQANIAAEAKGALRGLAETLAEVR